MILTCGHEYKRIIWNIVYKEYNKFGEECTSYSCVCPKCYHSIWKNRVISAKKEKF